jgi:soluble lytic murein transglycosylase
MPHYPSRFLALISTTAMLAVTGYPSVSLGTTKRVPLPRPRPTTMITRLSMPESAVSRPRLVLAMAETSPAPSTDLGAVKEALDLVKHHRADEATPIAATLHDPLARSLIEWAVLHSDDTKAGFDRYVAFMAAHPSWPNIGMFRRRAEAALWQEHRDPATVRAFFAEEPPMTAKGRFALARALLAEGDRAAAQRYVREAWDNDAFSHELETAALETFRDLLTVTDHKARMDARFADEDVEAGLRAAQHLGEEEKAVAKARAAVITKASNAGPLLDAVPPGAQRDPGYLFSRIQWLRRANRTAEAAQLLQAVPHDPSRLHNLDEWWVERRLLARSLLDLGDPRTAYQVARDAVIPSRENYRGEREFTAGWIALRFLNEPALAMRHFARIADGISNPITLARSEFWQGRAAEAAHRHEDARAHYEAAARFPTAYYGQIARAKLGLREISLRQIPESSSAQRSMVMNLELVRAIEILYATDARELVIPAVVDLADRLDDIRALSALAELTARHEDARATLLIGKAVLGRGYAFDVYAFPTLGVPRYGSVGPELDRSIVYAIVRQESEFDQRCVSSAHAYGLMQVTPEAGRYVAKRFGVGYDLKRLAADPVYNTQMGAAELGELFQDYRGSYILAFAAYNAGRGRVHEWIERYGDPRSPDVDPIDWVERIPFSETRNYVQRVMENLQVYRVRLGKGSHLAIEADLRAGAL